MTCRMLSIFQAIECHYDVTCVDQKLYRKVKTEGNPVCRHCVMKDYQEAGVKVHAFTTSGLEVQFPVD